MKESGAMIRLMVMDCLLMQLMLDMKVNGWKICSMALGKNSGIMGLHAIRGTSFRVRKTEKDVLTGKMEVTMKVNSLMDNFKVMEFTILQILKRPTKVNLSKVTWMVEAPRYGRTVADMRVILDPERKKVKGHLSGLTAINTLGHGRMGSSMV